MRKIEMLKRVTLVCDQCRGHSLIEGTPYPRGPWDVWFCPFCGVKQQARSEFEQAILDGSCGAAVTVSES